MSFKLLHITADHKVEPTVEALTMYPYEEIWARDQSPNKDLAYREYAYIAFMIDPRDENVFYNYDLESGARHAQIVENKFSRDYPNWEPDEVVTVCLAHYQDEFYRASPILEHYESNVILMNKLTIYNKTIDVAERHPRTGLPIFKQKDISDGVKNCEEMIVKLVSLKKKIDTDLFEKGKTKANRVINDFER